MAIPKTEMNKRRREELKRYGLKEFRFWGRVEDEALIKSVLDLLDGKPGKSCNWHILHSMLEQYIKDRAENDY